MEASGALWSASVGLTPTGCEVDAAVAGTVPEALGLDSPLRSPDPDDVILDVTSEVLLVEFPRRNTSNTPSRSGFGASSLLVRS